MGQVKKVIRSECGRYALTDMHGARGVVCRVKPERAPIPNFKLSDIPYTDWARTLKK